MPARDRYQQTLPAHNPAEWPPEPGTYRLRLIKGGYPVPARIMQTTDGGWIAVIDGAVKTAAADPIEADWVYRIWTHGWRITEQEYNALLAFAKAVPEDHPARHPDRPITPFSLHPIPVPSKAASR